MHAAQQEIQRVAVSIIHTEIWLLGRQWVEEAMEECEAEQKVQREAQAEQRKQARQDIKRLQQQQIALLVARYSPTSVK